MDKEEYLKQIIRLLDQAAGDKKLTLQDYCNLCGDVHEDAEARWRAAEDDLENADQE